MSNVFVAVGLAGLDFAVVPVGVVAAAVVVAVPKITMIIKNCCKYYLHIILLGTQNGMKSL